MCSALSTFVLVFSRLSTHGQSRYVFCVAKMLFRCLVKHRKQRTAEKLNAEVEWLSKKPKLEEVEKRHLKLCRKLLKKGGSEMVKQCPFFLIGPRQQVPGMSMPTPPTKRKNLKKRKARKDAKADAATKQVRVSVFSPTFVLVDRLKASSTATCLSKRPRA